MEFLDRMLAGLRRQARVTKPDLDAVLSQDQREADDAPQGINEAIAFEQDGAAKEIVTGRVFGLMLWR